VVGREIDYMAEAANAQRFNELYGGIQDVFVPRVYPELSTRKVRTLVVLEGQARHHDTHQSLALGLT
jgi:aarF domain-containing kinase